MLVERETDPASLKHDRFSCSIRKLKVKEVVTPVLETVGHVPLEISKFCHYFLVHGGKIEGEVADPRPRRSPIPAGGQEVKLVLDFSGRAAITDKMRTLLRQHYDYEFDGTQRQNSDSEETDVEEELVLE